LEPDEAFVVDLDLNRPETSPTSAAPPSAASTSRSLNSIPSTKKETIKKQNQKQKQNPETRIQSQSANEQDQDTLLLSSFLLTSTQLTSIQSSYTYTQNPLWRVARVDGHARTLMSRYKVGFRMYSEFVPWPLPEVGQGMKDGEEYILSDDDDDDEGGKGGKDKIQILKKKKKEGKVGEVEEGEAKFLKEAQEVDMMMTMTTTTTTMIMMEGEDDGMHVEDGLKATETLPQGTVDATKTTTAMALKILPFHLRFYTQRECARLMGFPEDFELWGTRKTRPKATFYHQIGNAVVPRVIESIASQMLDALGM
jgi:site-specific DNA-cytosine methylase